MLKQQEKEKEEAERQKQQEAERQKQQKAERQKQQEAERLKKIKETEDGVDEILREEKEKKLEENIMREYSAKKREREREKQKRITEMLIEQSENANKIALQKIREEEATKAIERQQAARKEMDTSYPYRTTGIWENLK